jgi:HSP20 family protein
MNLVNWTPYRDMGSFFDRYYNLLGRPSIFDADEDLKSKDFDWRPSADISETRTHYVIKAQLPEVDKKDIHVEVEKGILTISGERRFEKEEESEEQHRVETMYGKFIRSFSLPADADDTHITAKTRNGVLKVRIPKKAEVKVKTHEIAID